ncbi:MAG TPA: hypothetical protein PK504_02825 [Ferruginibacter sp.]|nr:hypothetical protein [Ferruginibacter sp.]
MTKKVILLAFVFCLSLNHSFSQDNDGGGYTGGLTKFLSWISNIDNVLLGIDNKENLSALNRNLGYTILYIDEIATGKLLLAKEIADLKSDKDDDKHISSLSNRADEIVVSITNLNSYLRKIKSLLSQTNQKEIDSIVLEIEQGFQYRKLHLLKQIKEGLYKKNISYNEILQDAQESKKIADNALKEIKVAKEKIVAVLTK